MKRFLSCLLTFAILLSLAGCGSLSLKPEGDDSEPNYGYIGDTLSTEWFDFTVTEAYACTEYHGYTAEEGYKLVVVSITLKNNCGASVDMWGEDFLILWGDSEEDFSYDIPLPAGLSDDQFPDEYVLGINAEKTGTAVYQVPEQYRDFSVGFLEVWESETDPDGEMGGAYYVDFTAEVQ